MRLLWFSLGWVAMAIAHLFMLNTPAQLAENARAWSVWLGIAS